MTTRCAGETANGAPCRVAIQAGRTFCLWHDPARRADADAARRKAGKRTAQRRAARGARVADPSQVPGPLETIEDAARWLSWIVHGTATGLLDARTSHELTYGLRTFVDARRRADATDERLKALAEKLRRLQLERGA